VQRQRSKDEKGKEKKTVVTVVLKVDMHCHGCARRIRASPVAGDASPVAGGGTSPCRWYISDRHGWGAVDLVRSTASENRGEREQCHCQWARSHMRRWTVRRANLSRRTQI
jgi:hypothetical protein